MPVWAMQLFCHPKYSILYVVLMLVSSMHHGCGQMWLSSSPGMSVQCCGLIIIGVVSWLRVLEYMQR